MEDAHDAEACDDDDDGEDDVAEANVMSDATDA